MRAAKVTLVEDAAGDLRFGQTRVAEPAALEAAATQLRLHQVQIVQVAVEQLQVEPAFDGQEKTSPLRSSSARESTVRATPSRCRCAGYSVRTPSTVMPARRADRTPLGESSIATHRSGTMPSRCAVRT